VRNIVSYATNLKSKVKQNAGEKKAPITRGVFEFIFLAVEVAYQVLS
jgi:hypothetical protein